MLKLILSLTLFTTFLLASDKVEIYASTMTSKEDIVEASGGVSVMYENYFLTAKKATYNKKTGDLELFNNIFVNYNGKSKIIGSYARLNLAKKEKSFKPFYMLDASSKVWISANEGNAKGDDLAIEDGMISGCNPLDPLWTMNFSSSDYNSKTKWINLYNTRLYLYDIPIFYTPYFGYSLDKTRRTGLLKPSFGLSSSEGIFYEQPFYIAEQNWWDLEITPQVRTNRGSGIYSTFRFVDSPTSHGEFNVGYFKEQEDYFLRENLQNDKHYGFNFKYSNVDFINQWFNTNLEGQSGLYTDIGSMNDVDYINLADNNSINQSTATQVLSRINMFYNTDNYYLGSYFKYYQDLTISSNENTLQKLPTLQYHTYLDTFLQDHLFYSLDVKSNNIHRQINKKVVQTDLNLPVTLQTHLFDEYLNLAYNANIYGQYSKFHGEEKVSSLQTEYNDGYILKNYHDFSASTQLTKAFDTVTHVIQAKVSYTQNGSEMKTGYYEDNKAYCATLENQTNGDYAARCEFFNINDVENTTKLEFIQYLYDSDAKEFLYHRLSQNISYSGQNRYGELENELNYKITKYFSIYNNTFYNYDKNLFSKIINSISYTGQSIKVDLSHLYKDSFIEPNSSTDNPRHTSYFTSSAEYTYNKHYSFNGAYNFDMEKSEKKSMEVGFLYKKRCWDFGLRYAENNRPVLTTDGTTQSVYDRYVYLNIVLKPFMQSSKTSSTFSYKLPSQN